MPTRILLVCATRPEWNELKGFAFESVKSDCLLFQASSPPVPSELVLCQTGMGWRRAEESIKIALSEKSPDLVIHFGLSGALRPELKIGDLFIPKECVAEDQKLDQIRFTSFPVSHPVHSGVFLTSREVLTTPQKKLAAGEKYNAHAVDMETYPIAAHCQKVGVPYLSLRGIFDPLEWDLSLLAESESMDEKGDVKLGRVGKEILRKPKLLLHLPKYQAAMSKANKAVRECLIKLLEK